MSSKCEFAANPATYIDIPDGLLLTLPNRDWAWGAIAAVLPVEGEA